MVRSAVIKKVFLSSILIISNVFSKLLSNSSMTVSPIWNPFWILVVILYKFEVVSTLDTVYFKGKL